MVPLPGAWDKQVYENSLYLPPNFAVNLKLLEKIVFFKRLYFLNFMSSDYFGREDKDYLGENKSLRNFYLP
jgi:hypothetical protein